MERCEIAPQSLARDVVDARRDYPPSWCEAYRIWWGSDSRAYDYASLIVPTALREAVRQTHSDHPLTIHAWVVLPEHLHCVIELPAYDRNFAICWRLIKTRFSRQISPTQWRNAARQQRGERGIWQRRFWGHLVRDEQDFAAYLDYVHINPVKHGLATALSQRRDGIKLLSYGAARCAQCALLLGGIGQDCAVRGCTTAGTTDCVLCPVVLPLGITQKMTTTFYET